MSDVTWKMSVVVMTISISLSALMVINIRHQSRLAFIAYQKEEERADRLDDEWGRLLLEKATWSIEHNIAHEAENKLGMITPSPDQIVTLKLYENYQ